MEWFLLLIPALLLLLFFVWRGMRGRKLRGGALARVQEHWKAASSHHDPVRKVLDADSVLDQALKELGYTGSLGDKLKKAAPRFSRLDDVWKAHKLRNRLAHEPGGRISEREAEQALRALESAIKDLS